MLRAEMRKLDREIANLKNVEIKTKNMILAADRRARRAASGPNANSRAKQQAEREVRDFARELVRTRKTTQRMITSRAQLASVQMQVNEAFALRKIQGSIRASVGIMKDVNALIRLPELAVTMRDLSVELMKAGIIEEMAEEMLPTADVELEMEDEEAEGEVDKVLGEILKDRMEKTGPLPSVPTGTTESVPAQQALEEEDADTQAMLDQMRNRLEALRS